MEYSRYHIIFYKKLKIKFQLASLNVRFDLPYQCSSVFKVVNVSGFIIIIIEGGFWKLFKMSIPKYLTNIEEKPDL